MSRTLGICVSLRLVANMRGPRMASLMRCILLSRCARRYVEADNIVAEVRACVERLRRACVLACVSCLRFRIRMRAIFASAFPNVSRDRVRVSECATAQVRSYVLLFSVSLRDVCFTGNAAVGGGAIYAYSGDITVRDSVLSGNTAAVAGSSLLLSGTVSLSLVNTTVRGSGGMRGGSAVVQFSAAGSFSMAGGSAIVAGAGSEAVVTVVAAAQSASFAVDASSMLGCRAGDVLSLQNLTISDIGTTCSGHNFLTTSADVACAKCPEASYALLPSSLTGFGAPRLQNVSCVACPFGGVCAGGDAVVVRV